MGKPEQVLLTMRVLLLIEEMSLSEQNLLPFVLPLYCNRLVCLGVLLYTSYEKQKVRFCKEIPFLSNQGMCD